MYMYYKTMQLHAYNLVIQVIVEQWMEHLEGLLKDRRGEDAEEKGERGKEGEGSEDRESKSL